MSKPLTESSNIRWFPVIVDRMARPRNNKIPWKLAEVVYEGYSRRYGTEQSLERLAERGGFGVLEVADHLGSAIEERDWQLAAVVEAAWPVLSWMPDNDQRRRLAAVLADLPAAAQEIGANQHNSEVCVPRNLYEEANTKGRQAVEQAEKLAGRVRQVMDAHTGYYSAEMEAALDVALRGEGNHC